MYGIQYPAANSLYNMSRDIFLKCPRKFVRTPLLFVSPVVRMTVSCWGSLRGSEIIGRLTAAFFVSLSQSPAACAVDMNLSSSESRISLCSGDRVSLITISFSIIQTNPRSLAAFVISLYTSFLARGSGAVFVGCRAGVARAGFAIGCSGGSPQVIRGLGGLRVTGGLGIGGRFGPATVITIGYQFLWTSWKMLNYIPKASSCTPVMGAPPQIQELTPHAESSGTGGAGTSKRFVEGSIRGGRGFRWLNMVLKYISMGPIYSI